MRQLDRDEGVQQYSAEKLQVEGGEAVHDGVDGDDTVQRGAGGAYAWLTARKGSGGGSGCPQ